MGCASSSKSSPSTTQVSQGKDASVTSKSSERKQETMRLLEEYSVGQTLGEGAFGVVSNCKKRSTGEEFAVKMVDKVETPSESIRKEAEMLQALDHPNIVKVHGIFYERCFVCIVMDKYSGGDLVEGLQRHLKDRGQIDCHDIVHVARQMGAGIKYLHARNVVHRDVKGDNFLMDRKDMTDAKCKIVLTDFGTACTLGREDRLSEGVGTKIFWSPEFFDRNYGAKVDVWAMGIIKYGLVSGRFPFKDENDVRTKEVKIPKRVHPVCEEFIRQMLDKVEASRPTADQVMAHKWVAEGSRRDNRVAHMTSEDDMVEGNLKEEIVNDGIKERRQELISRLNREDQLKRRQERGSSRMDPRHHLQKSFVLVDKQVPGMKVMYEWWDREKAAKLLDPAGEVKSRASANEANRADDTYLKMFSGMLRDHNIEVDKFGQGQAKKLDQLAGEVISGAARLMLDATSHKRLVRVVDIVLLRIRSADKERRLLIETEEKFPDGRPRTTLRLPGTKKEPYENTRQVAERILEEMLNIPRNAVKFDLRRVERHEEEIESPSYPGFCTVYRKEFIEGVITSSDTSLLTRVGLPSYGTWAASDKAGNTKFFEWMTDQVAESKKVKLKGEVGEAVSTLVRAPIGMAEEPLREHLMSKGVDVSKFGQPGCKTIKAFSAELIRGEATLQMDILRKDLVRMVDVVLMVVTNAATGEILVQADQVDPHGNRTRLDRLPGAKCRPDENQFLSARRILRRQLEIDENSVILSRDVAVIEEEKHSPAYPGLRTVYRKRLIKAELQVAA